MGSPTINHMFNFTYEKTSTDIVDKAKKKIEATNLKIEERQQRITKIREEYKITDAGMIDLLYKARKDGGQALTYSVSNGMPSPRDRNGAVDDQVVIGAGVVSLILRESDLIETERDQVEKLSIVVRNLKDSVVYDHVGVAHAQGHKLAHEELKFLGF